jgi:hypothetical protein
MSLLAMWIPDNITPGTPFDGIFHSIPPHGVTRLQRFICRRFGISGKKLRSSTSTVAKMLVELHCDPRLRWGQFAGYQLCPLETKVEPVFAPMLRSRASSPLHLSKTAGCP